MKLLYLNETAGLISLDEDNNNKNDDKKPFLLWII